MADKEETLAGGQVTSVTKIGDEVHRTAESWTPTVHRLLRYLETMQLDTVPRVVGADAKGREVLSYIDGDAGAFGAGQPTPPNLWSDQVLAEGAAWLRRYHDATVAFARQTDDNWQLVHPDTSRHEVICHNDFAPYNCLFVDGHLAAVIDFDTAGPGPRLDDIAYALYCFVPLFTNEKSPGLSLRDVANRGPKIQLFCDTYGAEYCQGVIDAVIGCVETMRDAVAQDAAQATTRQRRKASEAHARAYDADIEFIKQHQAEWQKLLG